VSRAGTAVAVLVALAAPAWADHGGLRTEGMNPVWAAILWAAVAFLVGMAIVGIASVLIRRRPSGPRDG